MYSIKLYDGFFQVKIRRASRIKTLIYRKGDLKDPDSNSIILQLVILLILIGVNAFFAMSEIAIVTFNDNKLKKLAEDGNKRAATLYKMVQQPSKFLSTIQIGVTMAAFWPPVPLRSSSRSLSLS